MKTQKYLILISVMLSLSGFALKATAQRSKHNGQIKKTSETIVLSEPLICSNLNQRNNLQATNFTKILPDTVSKLYCFYGIVEVKKPQKIKHVWYYNDTAVAEVTMNIRKTSVRGWSWLELPRKRSGKWKIEILDEQNRILKTAYFELTNESIQWPKLVVTELPDISIQVAP